MAYEIPLLPFGRLAAADLSAKQYYAVKLDGAEKFALCSVRGEAALGILQDQPTSGQVAQVETKGISKAVAGAAVTTMDKLTTDASGKLIPATLPSDYVCAIALEDASGDGIVFSCMLVHAGTLLSETAPTADGKGARGLARATFDPSAVAAHRTIGAHLLGVKLPNKAIPVRSFYEVITTFTSATDAATIKLGHEQVDDAHKAAVAISNGANPWDDGYVEGVQTNTAATFGVKLTAERELVATVAVEELTAGKLVLFVEYVISDAG